MEGPVAGGSQCKNWIGTIHGGHIDTIRDAVRLADVGTPGSQGAGAAGSPDEGVELRPDHDPQGDRGHQADQPALPEGVPSHDRAVRRFRHWIDRRLRQLLGLGGDVRHRGVGHLAGSVYQLEEAPSTGTIHAQILLSFERRVRLPAVVKALAGSWRGLSTKADVERALAYVQKDPTRLDHPDAGPVSHGAVELSHTFQQGRRTDIESVQEALDAGHSMLDISSRFFSEFKKYYKAFDVYQSLRMPKRDWKTEVHVLWGPPGSGKTTYAINEASIGHDVDEGPAVGLYLKANNKWWDGYTNQEHVIFDDYNGGIDLTTFLHILDKTPLTVEVKGSTKSFVARHVWITTNVDPRDWYQNHKDRFGALARRVDEWIVFDPPWELSDVDAPREYEDMIRDTGREWDIPMTLCTRWRDFEKSMYNVLKPKESSLDPSCLGSLEKDIPPRYDDSDLD